MSAMSRNKGAGGEREVSALIEDASGGVFKAQRGCQHAGRFAVGVASPDVVTDLPCHVEVKRTETFSPSYLLQAERERDEWRECATMLAAAVDYYHRDLRDAEDGFSAERAAIARFDELEARK